MSRTKRIRVTDAKLGRVNVSHDVVAENVRANIKRPLPQVRQHGANDYRVALLCGGPSLADAQLGRLKGAGYKFCTVNATHDWLIERGYTPSVHVQLDARPHNARFVQNPVSTCRYLICSQVHPSVFDALDGYDVHIWHAPGGKDSREFKIVDRHYHHRWFAPPGGSSVGTRAMWLLYVIGVRKIRIFGLDSCLLGGAHHAYEQPENDEAKPQRVRVGRKTFQAHGWMVSQADEFLKMSAHMPDDLNLFVAGDGLIAHMIKETAARGGKAPKMTVYGN